MDKIIEIEHLTKSFGNVRAVDDISFCVGKGEFFSFLGINGAGKSTTISMICGQLKKDGGTIRICGQNTDSGFAEISRRIGVVFQTSVLDAPLTVADNLRSRAALYGIHGKEYSKRLDELCRLLDLSPLLDRPLCKLSGGQKRRIDIARALIHNPEILILDEPTTGLDPQTRKNLWDVIASLRKEKGMTVFLTTHYMEETADADYIVILDSGKIVADGTPLQLKNAYAGDYVTIYNADAEKVNALGYPVSRIRDAFRISVPNTEKATELIVSHPELFTDYEVVKGKMDDVFLAATGKRIDGGDR